MHKIKMVEIEIDKYCNRKCGWCPNRDIDRTEHSELSFDIYIKLLNELKELNFDGVISYSRNNEPFSNFDLLHKYTLKAKEVLPNVKLVTNTNGDFLKRNIIQTTVIDEISIMDYDGLGLPACIHKITSLGGDIEYIDSNVIYATVGNKKLAYCSDWTKNTLLEHRGGYITESVEGMKFRNNLSLRDYPCVDPGRFLAIDYNGNVMPCCSMRSDNLAHEEYIMGNIHNETILEIFEKENNQKLINQINTSTGLNLPYPCQKCHKGLGRYMKDNPSIYFSNRYINGGEYEAKENKNV